ncbi:MAG TPA: AI-2E family transporter [Acetobacteraceae bacterium]|nr:AI-2E family transporter [Acetobacteraceae bacterium]
MDPSTPHTVLTPAQRIASAALTVTLTLLGLWTLHEFLPALIWAGIFAIALWPLYRRTSARLPSSRHNLLMPALFTFGVALVFLLPLVLVAVPLSNDAHSVFVWVQQARKTGIPPPDFLSRLPLGRGLALEWWQDNLGSPDAASDLLHRLAQADLLARSREYGSLLAHRLALFGFTLLTLFFLFRDGERLIAQTHRAIRRLFGPHGERIAQQMIASVHGTVDGLVLVGLGEGVLLGIAYVVAGVPHPTLFGLLTAVAAMIPFGAPVLFLLAALILLVQGAMLAAIGVAVFGMVVTFVADHFIRPVLIGGTTRLPFIWVLLGILGGLGTWGLLGLFVGPALMAALILLWREGTALSTILGTEPPTR